jgi:diaminopimelate epimerase
MKIHFYKYQATGNDFIIIDAMKSDMKLKSDQIRKMCNRHFGIGADGLMTISPSDEYDFQMTYYNADGYEGSMCGNGGRSIICYANSHGLAGVETKFEAAGSVYKGWIEEDELILGMNDVKVPELTNDLMIDTGSPHVIVPVEFLENYDVSREGRRIREERIYQPKGVNVNFINEHTKNEISQRTYERGVEAETLSCGTGAVAGAVYQATRHELKNTTVMVHMPGGDLKVYLIRSGDIYNAFLSGPAAFVFEGDIIL